MFNDEKIAKMLRDGGVWADVFDISKDDKREVILVEIRWGDWKHDHARARYLMGEAGYALNRSKVTEENGSDTYSAIHEFVKRRG